MADSPKSKPGYGKCISDFRVGAILGNGGFSEVYTATSRINNNEVAIKFIARRQTVLRDAEFRKRVRSEIELHSQLKHPSIVSFYGAFEDEHYIYLAMELLDEDLESHLKTHDLSLRRAKDVFWQITLALEYLHGIGVIHRDLKPGNILLKISEHGTIAKLADFGLATYSDKLQSDCWDQPFKSNSTFCGTPDFMAPEMFAKTKNRKVGESADIWSLGVLLYIMLTGDRPFKTTGKPLSEIARERTSPVALEFDRIADSRAQDLLRLTICRREEGRLSASDILQHPWLAETVIENAKLIPVLNSSLDSGNCSDRSDASNTSRSRSCNLAPYTPERVLDVITESSISGCNQVESINFSSFDPRKFSLNSEISRSSGCSGNAGQTRPNVVPLNTKYLKAQRVKVGETVVCSILDSGEVVVEFLRSSKEALWVTDVIQISADGKEVKEYQPQGGSSALLSDTPPPAPPIPTIHFLPNLPGKVRKSYQIASGFVDLVRSKTVKHWICTDKARSNLMRNEPHPNVESNFYDGIKIVHGSDKIQVKKENVCVLTLHVGPSQIEMKQELLDHWEHHVWCREHLIEKDRQTREVEKTSPRIKILAMGYGRKPNAGLSSSQPEVLPATGLLPRSDRNQSRDMGAERSLTSSSDSYVTPAIFSDGMRVTVLHGGQLLKFEHSDPARNHTCALSGVPTKYLCYVTQLEEQGHLQRRDLARNRI